MADSNDDTPLVTIGNKPLAAELSAALVEVRVERILSQPSRCVLRFTNTDYAEASFRPGTLVEVKHRKVDDTIFYGEIGAVELERRSATNRELTAVAYDFSLRLASKTSIATFLKRKPENIIQWIADQHSLQVVIGTLGGVRIPYHLQASTDLELLDLLASRTGADWWFDGATLKVDVLTVGSAKTYPIEVTKSTRLSVRASAHHPDRVLIRGWDSTQQMAIEQKLDVSGDAIPATGEFVKIAMANAWTGRNLVTSALPVSSDAEARMLAEASVRQSMAGAVHIEGESTDLKGLLPGMALDISYSDFAGKYLITEVIHRWSPAEALVTTFVGGGHRAGVGAELTNGSAPTRPADTYHGMVAGKVTNIKDPDERGRVKVTYVGLTDTQESTWARVLIPGAGKARGAVALPEVNDEVLVGFEGGDLRKPVVLGGLFNTKSHIPKWTVDSSAGVVSARRTTSRLGHFMEFGDQIGPEKKEHVLLSLADEKTQLRLGSKDVELLVPEGNPLSIKVGTQSSIEFDGTGKITINCLDLEIKSKKGFTTQAMTAEHKADTNMKLQANANLEMQGGAQAKLNGSAMVEIKGGIVKIN